MSDLFAPSPISPPNEMQEEDQEGIRAKLARMRPTPIWKGSTPNSAMQWKVSMARCWFWQAQAQEKPRVDHPHRPYSGHASGHAMADPVGDLHQQGGPRDEGAHRFSDRRISGRHAVAGHIPIPLV